MQLMAFQAYQFRAISQQSLECLALSPTSPTDRHLLGSSLKERNLGKTKRAYMYKVFFIFLRLTVVLRI